jgi:hypothetical protein
MANRFPGVLWPSADNDEELHASRAGNSGTSGTAGAASSVLKIGAACAADSPRRWSSLYRSTGQSTVELTDAVEPAELKETEQAPTKTREYHLLRYLRAT